MKILIRSESDNVSDRVVIIKTPEEKRKIHRFLDEEKYARAIEYMLVSGEVYLNFDGDATFSGTKIDLILTPNSAHWDLM